MNDNNTAVYEIEQKKSVKKYKNDHFLELFSRTE